LLRDVGIDEERLASVVLFILAITLHNMPEGLAVSVAAVNAGLDRRFYAVVTGIRSGLVEIPLVLLGALAVSVAEPVLPYAMGFAAGAMLFVISDEIVPETHVRGNKRISTSRWGERARSVASLAAISAASSPPTAWRRD